MLIDCSDFVLEYVVLMDAVWCVSQTTPAATSTGKSWFSFFYLLKSSSCSDMLESIVERAAWQLAGTDDWSVPICVMERETLGKG